MPSIAKRILEKKWTDMEGQCLLDSKTCEKTGIFFRIQMLLKLHLRAHFL